MECVLILPLNHETAWTFPQTLLEADNKAEGGRASSEPWPQPLPSLS